MSPKTRAWCPAAAHASTQAGSPSVSRVDAMNAEVARFDRALAPRRPGPRVLDPLVHEGARLERARHHAVAAADAGVLVHQHDAVRALERGAGGADVDAGRVRAVLAHQRQGADPAGRAITQRHLVDPSGIGRGSVHRLESVLVVAGAHAGVAVAGALGGIDEHPVAHLAADRLARPSGPAGAGERNDGETGRQHRTGHDPRPREKPAPRRASETVPVSAHALSSPDAIDRRDAPRPRVPAVLRATPPARRPNAAPRRRSRRSLTGTPP